MIDVCRSMALQDTHHYDGKSQYFLYIISTYRAGGKYASIVCFAELALKCGFSFWGIVRLEHLYCEVEPLVL